MKKYNSYKPSGENYIGDIPQNWECIRLGMLGVFSSSGIDKKTNENETSVRMVNYTDIIQSRKYNPIQSGEKDYMVVSTPKSKLDEHRLIKGDMVFIPSSETKEDLGYSSLIDFDENDIVYSYHILRYRTHKNIYHYFKKYLINHHSVLNQFSRESKGTTRQIIGRNVFNNVRVVLPPLQEQEQIVNYLDEKTTIIDKLISTKQRKVELLKEQRTTLINQVITKGLNPDVKMKDSGVEWIGYIPENWRFIPSKYFTIKKNGIQTGPFGTQLNTKDYVSYGIKVMNQKTLIDEDYIIGEEYISEKKFELLKGFEVIEGDIILGTRGSFGTGKRTTFGKCSIVPKLNEINVLHPCLIRIRVDEDCVIKKFIYIYINESTHFLEDVRNTSNSTTIEVIYGITLKDIKFPIPPIKEQQEIVEYLDKQTKEIDDLISMEQNKIELLKEYRQSLISEVITGKIKIL
jgi:type I restriction enzyme S subunit